MELLSDEAEPLVLLLLEFIESAEVSALEPEPVVLPFEYMLLFEPDAEVPVEPEPLVPVPVAAAVPDVPEALPVPCMVPLENCLLLVAGAVLPALVPVPAPVGFVPVILPLVNTLLPVPVGVAGSAAWTTAKTLAMEKAAAAVVMIVLDTFMMNLLWNE